jgi:hypothetical protein
VGHHRGLLFQALATPRRRQWKWLRPGLKMSCPDGPPSHQIDDSRQTLGRRTNVVSFASNKSSPRRKKPVQSSKKTRKLGEMRTRISNVGSKRLCRRRTTSWRTCELNKRSLQMSGSRLRMRYDHIRPRSKRLKTNWIGCLVAETTSALESTPGYKSLSLSSSRRKGRQ